MDRMEIGVGIVAAGSALLGLGLILSSYRGSRGPGGSLSGAQRASGSGGLDYRMQVAETADSIRDALGPLFEANFFRVESDHGILVEFARMNPERYAKEQLRTRYSIPSNNHIRVQVVSPRVYPSPGWTDLTVKATVAGGDGPVWLRRKVPHLTPEKAVQNVVAWFRANADRLRAAEEESK